MTNIGYARVSSKNQSLEIQINKLKENKCDTIFKEKLSGIDGNRPELKACLRYLRADDTLIITKIDRLARSTLDLSQIVSDLDKRHIKFVVIDQQMDTRTPAGKLMLNMLGVIAQFENEIRKERQMEGIKRAVLAGKFKGRKPKLSKEQVIELKKRCKLGFSQRKLAKEFGLSQSGVCSILKR